MTWIARTAFLGVIIAGVAGGLLYWQVEQPALMEGEQAIIDLPPGGGVWTVGRDLSAQNIASRWQTRLAGWWYLDDRETLKKGRYVLQGPMSWGQVFAKLTKGEAESMTITFIEGKRWRDFKEQLKKNEMLSDKELLDLPDNEIAQILREGRRDWVCPPGVLEGCLMPETYVLNPGLSVFTVLQNAYSSFDAAARTVWRNRDADLPLESPYQMVILASIVEKETGTEEDRGRVARVFVNRLKRGMRLQSDPTVIYGVENFNGNLTRQHLRMDHPYNTYVRVGLTPRPIASVGRASMEAVVRPLPGRWLYFVARPDGSTAFSETLAEHNSAVWRYQVAPARARPAEVKQAGRALEPIPRIHH